MKGQIKVSRSELLNKLLAVGKVVRNKSVAPDHDKFLFEVKDGFLKVTGADGEGNIITAIDCECQFMENAKFLIEHKIILDGLKALPEQPLVIDIENGDAKFKHASGVYDIPVYEADQYLVLENREGEAPVILEMESRILIEGIRKAYGFAANDDLRPILNSVFVECISGKLTFTASNSSVMAVMEYEPIDYDDFSLAIPIKIAKIISDLVDDDSVRIEMRTKVASFICGETKISCRLVEGRYPNYRSVIPQNNDNVIKADTREFIGSLKRTSIFTNKSSLLISLELMGNSLTIKGKDNDFKQSAEEHLNIEHNESANFEIGFKSEFLLKCLETIDTENVKMSFSDPNRAALLTPVEEDESNSSLTILIMPMMIAV